MKEKTTLTGTKSSKKPVMHAVIGWFDSSAGAEMAIKAWKQAGFAEASISIRDGRFLSEQNEELQAKGPNKAMVAVQAEGERAAEAWSILQDARERSLKEKQER